MKANRSMMNYQIIENDYQFECTLCANCCMGDTQIFLDFYDLYKIAAYLKYPHSGELFKQGFVFLNHGENNVWRPQLRFKSKPFRFCPFLDNHFDDERAEYSGLCRLHPNYKPLVCATAPIGRRFDFSADKIEYIFHPPAPDCQGIHKNTVNSIHDLETTYRKEFKYQLMTFRILDRIRRKKGALSKDETLKLYHFDIKGNFDAIIQKIADYYS